MLTHGFSYTVEADDNHARLGRFTTPRAVLETPAFMPVGTQASIKSQSPDEVEATGAKIVLANTYHLWLRPGAETVQRLGGVQKFMSWPHAVLTDSGGYQVFSLATLRTIDDHGVTFRSHIDGTQYRLTPEESMRVQALLGSDIAMAFDECPPGQSGRETVENAMRRTTAWAKRCLATSAREGQARFGISQGGTFLDLRRQHLDEIAAMPFDGFALGGFSVGEPVERMYELLSDIGPRMPREKPRYLMGVGTPHDLLKAIGAGIDLFDCVLPTRNGRNGQAFTAHGRVNLRQSRHREDSSPLEDGCDCPTCSRFSRGYLRHLFKSEEILGPRLAAQHNLHFYARLTRMAREAIRAQRYDAFARDLEQSMRDGDEIASPTVAGPIS